MSQHSHPQFARRVERVFGKSAYEPRRVCIIDANDAGKFNGRNLECRCEPGRGRHYARSKVDTLLAMGEMAFAGKDKRVAYFTKPMTWRKVTNYDRLGVPTFATMQMVRGGGL